jgi:hypothetical protein
VDNAVMAMREENKVIRQPYTFEVDFSAGAGLLAGQFGAPAPNASVQGNFLVDSSSPFMLVSGTYQTDVAGAVHSLGGAAAAGAGVLLPNLTVAITDQSSNRSWMNQPVPVAALFGYVASLPYFWPQPRLVPANSNIQVVLANFDPAVTYNCRLQFHGYRFYALGA